MLALEDNQRADCGRSEGGSPARQPSEHRREAGAGERGEAEDDHRSEPRRDSQSIETRDHVEQQPVRAPRAGPHRQPHGEDRDEQICCNRSGPSRARAGGSIHGGAKRQRAGECGDDDHKSMEQLALAAALREHAAPVPRAGRDAEVVGQLRAQPAELVRRPLESHLSLELVEDDRDRRDGRGNRRAREREIPGDARPGETRARDLNRQHRHQRDEEEIEVVRVREAEHDVPGGKGRDPPALSGLEVPVQRPERQRHPPVHQHLQVRRLRDAVRREREGEAGEKRGVGTAPQMPRQHEHP